jgi:O-methyltransferase
MKNFEQTYNMISNYTLVDKSRCKVLFELAESTYRSYGDWFECGVFRGGTAMLLNEIKPFDKKLYLFDTFEGMPEVCSKDNHHKKGDFNNTSLEEVRSRVGDEPIFKKGFIPDTFVGLEDVKLSFAHIDVDIYQSVIDCCEFIYPRMYSGGFMVFDDYGFKSCKGAKIAVHEFFDSKPEKILILENGQAIVEKK